MSRSSRQQAAAQPQLQQVPAAPGSPYHILTTVPSDRAPTVAERVLMAQHVQQHQGRGAYVQARLRREAAQQAGQQPNQESKEMSVKPEGAPEGATKSEGQQAEPRDEHGNRVSAVPCPLHASCNCTDEERRKAAKQKAKEAAARKTRDVTPKTPKHAAPEAPVKPHKGKPAPAAAAPKSKGGRPAKAADPKQKYRVVKDNTRSGHMKVFMTKAAELKSFTRAELVGATKTKVTAERAERYFDYCLYKGLIGEAR